MNTENIQQINDAITAYFDTHTEDYIPAKDIMPALIEAGVFTKDVKKGLPLRKVLRKLDEENTLNQIPFVHAVRKEKNIYWYFVREGAEFTPQEETTTLSKKQLGIQKRVNSDEHYVLNLCDELLGTTASRQHRFSFLLGDFHKDKKSRTKLPVDAYYQDLNLVVEYVEKNQPEETDTTKTKTVSGVSKTEQRKIYNNRRKDVLERKKINLIEINYYAFEYDNDMKIVRNKEKDIKIVKELLNSYL